MILPSLESASSTSSRLLSGNIVSFVCISWWNFQRCCTEYYVTIQLKEICGYPYLFYAWMIIRFARILVCCFGSLLMRTTYLVGVCLSMPLCASVFVRLSRAKCTYTTPCPTSTRIIVATWSHVTRNSSEVKWSTTVVCRATVNPIVATWTHRWPTHRAAPLPTAYSMVSESMNGRHCNHGNGTVCASMNGCGCR